MDVFVRKGVVMNNRFQKIKFASVLGIVGNLFLLIIKSIIGYLTNSQAMIADSFNSFSDVFSSFMTFIGNKISNIPKDDDHNLGHGKAEYIYSLLISILMFILSFKSFYTSSISLFLGQKYEFSYYLIIVCLITIIVKLILFLYTYNLSKKYNSILLSANSKDHRNDCIITFANLLSSLFALFNIYFIDSVVGIIISIWIFITAFKIFKESYDVLMDKSIDEDTKRKVLDIIDAHPEIKNIRHFNSTPVGYKYQISFTIFVDGNLSTYESHKIADNLEDEIEEKLEEIYLTIIHVNPVED